MKLLLATVESGCIHSKLALNYMYNVVADAPLETTVRHFTMRDRPDMWLEEMSRGQYDIVYFHCNMRNETKVLELCRMVKELIPKAIVAVGGMQVTFDTREFMAQHLEVDFVIRGEAEGVFYNFIKEVITYNFNFRNIDGLAFWDNNQIIVNRIGPPMDLTKIPFPYERLKLDNRIAYYESMRGCPDRCKYSQYLLESGIRALPLDRVYRDLRYFTARGVKKVRIVDKWFNFDPARAYAVWKSIIQADQGMTCFEFDVNGDLLDDDAIKLLGRARRGLFEFNIDVDSINAETLAEAGRNENIYVLLYNVSRLLKDTSVTVNLYQKIGMPTETQAQFARSFNRIYGIGAHSLTVDVLKMRKGIQLRKEADKYGYMYNTKPPYEVIATDAMPAPSLIRTRMAIETAELYLGGNFEKSLAKIMADTGIKPFDLFMKLGSYIYKSGLAKKAVYKENLYVILYLFATALYDEMNDTLKLQNVIGVIKAEMDSVFPGKGDEMFGGKGLRLNG